MSGKLPKGNNDKLEEQWKFSQWFRKLPGPDDNPDFARNYELTALEFDKSGKFLASGDRSGTVVVLQNDEAKAAERGDLTHYKLFTEITSHKTEFDYLISKPVEPGITALKWGPQTNNSQYLLTTNTKQIRLWRMQNRETVSFTNFNNTNTQAVHINPHTGKKMVFQKLKLTAEPEPVLTNLKVPKVVREAEDVVTDLKRNYFKGSHKVFISQLSMSTDQETFMSSDSLSINQWSLHRDDVCHSLVDLVGAGKPLTEIILSLDHHPTKNNIFLYGTSKGKLNLCDMRVSANATTPSRVFNGLNKPAATTTALNVPLQEQVMIDEASMFDEVTSGITGMQFSGGGRFIITRDYMSIKIWDINYEKRPIETLYVQEFLRPRLFELHEHNRTWQDNFKITTSSKGNIATGTYSNYFHILDLSKKRDVFVQASMVPAGSADMLRMNKRKKVSYLNPTEEEYPIEPEKTKKFNLSKFISTSKGSGKKKDEDEQKKAQAQYDEYPFHLPFQTIDFNKKAAHICWHPEQDVIAVAGENNLYMYSKKIA